LIGLDRLIANPENPNKMSRANFGKLVRNIKRTGRYEPIVVRRHPQKGECFEIINGYHRCLALGQLGYKQAEVVVWDVGDEEADILLATLNRLGGTDELGKKLKVLKRLSKKFQANELAKILPQTAKQIERLGNLKRPSGGAKIRAGCFASAMVFFLSDAQKQVVEQALSLATEPGDKKAGAVRNAMAVVKMAESFINASKRNDEIRTRSGS